MPEEKPKIKKMKKAVFTTLWRYDVTSLSLKNNDPPTRGCTAVLAYLSP